jgi:hypothetical protein
MPEGKANKALHLFLLLFRMLGDPVISPPEDVVRYATLLVSPRKYSGQ